MPDPRKGPQEDAMETLIEMKAAVMDAIDARASDILALGNRVFQMPEMGYREHDTAAMAAGVLRGLGLEVQEGLAITGVKAIAPGLASRPCVGVFGEMDAVVCHAHPGAHADTGAVHACGHNAQVAAMAGVAMGLIESGAISHLDGSVRFMAVPAEEYVEMEARAHLRRRGRIAFFGGKQEMIHRGHLDDVDMAMMFHLDSDVPERRVRLCSASNGFIGKMIRYTGREAHAGSNPHRGINALNAAMLGLMGIHVQRETFRDWDNIRVHPVLTKGGDLVNIVPSDVRMETYVRGNTMEAVAEASAKVDRALQAGAYAVGASVHIDNMPGYLPLEPDAELNRVFMENARAILGHDAVTPGSVMMGSTDMGDVTHIMPGIHPMVGGTTGQAHTRDFRIVDEEMAYIIPAKIMAMTVLDLLHPRGGRARAILGAFRARIARQGYAGEWERYIG
ncbi:MAG: amidohydrolase [Bacillota bacterium]